MKTNMNIFLMPLLPFAVFFLWLFIFGTHCRQICPDCKEPLGPFRSPFTKTKRQWVEGGYACRNCDCETDLAGRKVPYGTGLQWRWILISLGLPTIALGTALFLLTQISQR